MTFKEILHSKLETEVKEVTEDTNDDPQNLQQEPTEIYVPYWLEFFHC